MRIVVVEHLGVRHGHSLLHDGTRPSVVDVARIGFVVAVAPVGDHRDLLAAEAPRVAEVLAGGRHGVALPTAPRVEGPVGLG